MNLILFIVVSVLILALAYGIYCYLEKCRLLRYRLRSLGISPDRFSSKFKAFRLYYLRDLLYEKETEMAEQSFISADNSRNNY